MRHLLRILGVTAVVLVVASASASAATATQNVTATATVAARATLTLSAATLTFADANPDTTPSIAATEGAITVTAKGRTSAGGAITLAVVSADDFKSGTDVILASALTWGATGTGYVGGTMNKATAQSVGSWTGPGNNAGQLTFALANSWSYATGSYTMAVTYTLTAP